MALALRRRDEPRLPLPPLPSMTVRREFDATLLAEMQVRTVTDIRARFEDGHRAYVAMVDEVPAAWGWVATERATIGELKVAFTIPKGHRYLWNFVTLAAYRGRGVYPRLIDAIIDLEGAHAEEFWIAYAPENHASGTGIHRAGFTPVAELSFDLQGSPVVRGHTARGGAVASALLGIPDTTTPVSPCWKCARGPAPAESDCATGSCCCDYQRPDTSCAEEPAAIRA